MACLVWLLRNAGKEVHLTFIDPDIVEAGNIPRQNFCPAEIGRYKAEALAERYAWDFGMAIGCIPTRFSPDLVHTEWQTLTILVGCVDNAAARMAMNTALQANETLSSGECRTTIKSFLQQQASDTFALSVRLLPRSRTS